MKVDITKEEFNDKYQIIYADPPWKYGGSGGTKWLPASNYYETMTFEDAVDRLKKSYRDKLEWLDSQINNM